MNKNRTKRKERFSKTNKLKGEKLIGSAIKKWEPPEEPLPPASGAVTIKPPHISGAKTTNPPQHVSGN